MRGWPMKRSKPGFAGSWSAFARAQSGSSTGARTVLSLIAPTASAAGRGVLHHPLHQLIERDARIGSKFRHERGLGHAGLGIDLKADQLSRPPIVVAKVGAADPTAAERVMRSQSQSSDLLVNIW